MFVVREKLAKIKIWPSSYDYGTYHVGDQQKLRRAWNVRVAERLALPTSDHGVPGSNPAGGEILPELNRHFIVQSLSSSPFHRPEMTEILLKGRKTLTHPSIIRRACASAQSRQETSLFAHRSRTFRPKIRHLAPLDGCKCAIEEWFYGGRKVAQVLFIVVGTWSVGSEFR